MIYSANFKRLVIRIIQVVYCSPYRRGESLLVIEFSPFWPNNYYRFSSLNIELH